MPNPTDFLLLLFLITPLKQLLSGLAGELSGEGFMVLVKNSTKKCERSCLQRCSEWNEEDLDISRAVTGDRCQRSFNQRMPPPLFRTCHVSGEFKSKEAAAAIQNVSLFGN